MKIISEKTLYKYVFCPSALSEEERLFILKNDERFKEDLDSLNAIKASLEHELSDTILDKIHRKIIHASAKKGIVLNLINHSDNNEKCIFAADSVRSKLQDETCSYSDESNNYLIKVINKDTVNKIYVFTKDEILDLEYSVTLFPSKEVYYTNSEDMPLIISPQQNIKSIILKVN
ncbi:MAG: hypothetical protein OQJ81_12235 [Melioribacteraceae bacterium]|nr:hypothetical protein [Melioribacteraceae bacterium]